MIERADDGPMMIDIVGMDEPTQAVIITGNPVDGFSFIGPFPDEDAAREYGENLIPDDWWVSELETPIGAAYEDEYDDVQGG